MSHSTSYKSTYTWKFLALTAAILALSWKLITGSFEYKETVAVIGILHMAFGIILIIAHFLYILIFHPHKTITIGPASFGIVSFGVKVAIPWEQVEHFSHTCSLIRSALISDGKKMIRFDDMEFSQFEKLVKEIEHWRAKHAQSFS